MELNIETKQQLERLLAKPSLATQEHILFLQQLITAFPYYQPLYLLLAKASIETENTQNSLTKAALYTNGSILHSVINNQDLDVIENLNVIYYKPWTNANSIKFTEDVPTTLSTETTQKTAVNIPESPIIENLEPLTNDKILEETIVAAPQNNKN
ncbi:MAG: hypothetical protein EOO07_34320 [Chitinophagaceae bacterium]|nr:MAG: hypothetical protein EOO07_34320 [Chitinophagaceae bacterium]